MSAPTLSSFYARPARLSVEISAPRTTVELLQPELDYGLITDAATETVDYGEISSEDFTVEFGGIS